MLKTLLDKIRFRDAYIENNMVIDNVDAFKWDHEADLVVAGFGGAGVSAALEAHDLGLKTIVLDRLSGGGATNISGGVIYSGGGTRIQKEAGVEDSPENMFNYLKHEVRGAVSDETLKKFCDTSVENFDWLENYGVKFDPTHCPFKISYPTDQYYFYYSGNEGLAPYTNDSTPAMRGHRGHIKSFSGPAIFKPLQQSAIDKGISIQTQSKVVSLLTNTDGDVIGLKAIQLSDGAFSTIAHKFFEKLHIILRNTTLFYPILFNFFGMLTEWIERTFGKSTYIKANKGVVLSTGGFYNNQNMIKKYAPDFVGGSPLGTLADDGTGISMAMALGAKTECMDSVSAWRFINPPTAFVKGMLVGPTGQRICNEMLYGAQLGDEMMRNHEGVGYLILDEKTYKSVPKDLTLKKAQWFHILIGYFFIMLGFKKASSVRGLAVKLGIDSQALHDTFEEYNRIAASDALDPKGKPKDYMPPLGDGPYYAIDVSYKYFWAPCPSLTLGGLKVNEDTGQVIKEDGKEIKGLYAAGRTAVGIPSRGYVSGLSIADCIFSGRRAAKHAAS